MQLPTCAAIAAATPGAGDGDYMLNVEGTPVHVYCANMATNPSEYLPLPNSGVNGTANSSFYGTGELKTWYTRVRFHPDSLTVDIGDAQFATSQGTPVLGNATWPYADAGDCSGFRGAANVDLRGTPFFVVPGQFVSLGWATAGNVSFSASNQVANLSGGGSCGEYTTPNRARLQLGEPTAPPVALPSGVFTATIQTALTNECLAFGSNGKAKSPSRFISNDGSSTANCGFASKDSLVHNQSAVFTFVPIQDDLYVIQNASSGQNQCLVFGGNGNDQYPSRYNWGDPTASYCGFGSQQALLQNGQAVWRLVPLQGNQYAITNASSGQESCLAIDNNGTAQSPSRVLWGASATNCGFPILNAELYNAQAVWTIAPIQAPISFPVKSVYPWGNGITKVFSGDFDGDGIWDIGVTGAAGEGDGHWYIRYGDGHGGYGRQTAYNWENTLTNVFTGDFDGDGYWDIGVTGTAAENNGSWYIRYGDGAGNFGRQTVYNWGNNLTNIFTGDFDGDGYWDIGVTSTAAEGAAGSGNWYIRYGDGTGAFGRQTVYNWGTMVTNVFTGDFDGDGYWDIGVTGTAAESNSNWYIRFGDGTGYFFSETVYPAGNNVHNVVTGDFDGNHLWGLGVTGTSAETDRTWHFFRTGSTFTGQSTCGDYGQTACFKCTSYIPFWDKHWAYKQCRQMSQTCNGNLTFDASQNCVCPPGTVHATGNQCSEVTTYELFGTLLWNSDSSPMHDVRITIQPYSGSTPLSARTETTNASGAFRAEITGPSVTSVDIQAQLTNDFLDGMRDCSFTTVASSVARSIPVNANSQTRVVKMAPVTMPAFIGSSGNVLAYRTAWRTLMSAAAYATRQAGEGPGSVKFCIDPSFDGGGRYDPETNTLRLGAAGGATPQIQLHEYGHKIMGSWMGQDALKNLTKSASEDSVAVKCSESHAIGLPRNAKCALLEGWANFFALAAGQTTTFSSIDMENYRSDVNINGGYSSGKEILDEGWVTAMLLDLIDARSDGMGNSARIKGQIGFADDNSNNLISVSDMANAMMRLRPRAKILDSMRTFYRLLRFAMPNEAAKAKNDAIAWYDYQFNKSEKKIRDLSVDNMSDKADGPIPTP